MSTNTTTLQHGSVRSHRTAIQALLAAILLAGAGMVAINAGSPSAATSVAPVSDGGSPEGTDRRSGRGSETPAASPFRRPSSGRNSAPLNERCADTKRRGGERPSTGRSPLSCAAGGVGPLAPPILGRDDVRGVDPRPRRWDTPRPAHPGHARPRARRAASRSSSRSSRCSTPAARSRTGSACR